MKPRTKYEKAVMAQSGHLRPLPTAPRRWAFTNTINHYAFRLPKGRTTCMDCGHSWIMSEAAEKCTCPNCKAKLEVKETYTRKCQQKSYFNVITTCGEYQILRIFLLIVEMRKGFKASPAFLEIGQYWIAPNGKTALVALQRTMGLYLDCFAFGSPMEIRKDSDTYQHIANQYLYPKIKVDDCTLVFLTFLRSERSYSPPRAAMEAIFSLMPSATRRICSLRLSAMG